MSSVTSNVSDYIRKKGINLSKMSRDIGVPYMALYNSLLSSNRHRDLRDDEFLSICNFLNIDPRVFAERKEEKQS